ncbi:uncharacterized protein [Drosophila pseudoobscura]|uniref:Uncharacterized protein n=1 Tax=Drosophila pseudoobscura pseudoobscura TaxID=46245 RepID=A0A6I8UXG0_DROPS|nr:uncharacterized protein LOC6902908 [Drosophila pseudoobscura]
MQEERLADGCQGCQRLMDSNEKTATIILRAWHNRGFEICKLLKTKEHYKQKAMESSNNLHMYQVMIEVAENRNNELQLQVMESKMRTLQVHSSMLSLTADREQLQHEVDLRKKENEELKAVAEQRKTKTSAALMEQRKVLDRISRTEVAVFQLKLKNSDLVNAARMLRSSDRSNQLREQRLNKELQLKSEMIIIMQNEIDLLKERAEEWNDKELKENEQQMHPLIDQLQDLSRDHSSLNAQKAQDCNGTSSVFQTLWPTSLSRNPQPTIQKAFPFFLKLK